MGFNSGFKGLNNKYVQMNFFGRGATAPSGPGPLLSRLHDHTKNTSHSAELLWTSNQPCGKASDTTQNKRQTSMPPEVFEPANPSSE